MYLYLLVDNCMFLHCDYYFLTVLLNKSSLSGVWEGDLHKKHSQAVAREHRPQQK